MKCVGCGIETGFEWPGGTDPRVQALWEAAYEGPLCKLCSGDSPMRGLLDQQEPFQELCFALQRRKTGRSPCGFQSFFNSRGDGSLNLEDVEDL